MPVYINSNFEKKMYYLRTTIKIYYRSVSFKRIWLFSYNIANTVCERLFQGEDVGNCSDGNCICSKCEHLCHCHQQPPNVF